MERLIKVGIWIIGALVVAWICFVVYMALALLDVAREAVAAEPIVPEFDITVSTVIVHWFDSEMDLQEYFVDTELIGAAHCEYQEQHNVSLCDLYLVRPESLEDVYNLDTIGHELLHAFYGSYHIEDD